MSLHLDRATWERVRLGDVVRQVTDRVDAETSGLERFLAGEHIPSGQLGITDWGMVGRDPIGPMFYKRFRPGHVLYVSRRTYLRKVAVPEFEGITGEKTFVLESLNVDRLLQLFLPFIVSSETFHAYAIANSRGSVNPYLNWTELADYEFHLPQPEDQGRLARLLWGVEKHRLSVEKCISALSAALRIRRDELMNDQTLRATRGDKAFDILMGRQRSPQRATGPNMTNYLRSANVGDGRIDLSDVLQMDFDPAEQRRFGLAPGDVLVSEGSASEHAVGMASVWRGELPGVTCFQNTLLRYRAIKDVSSPGFAAHWCAWAFQSGGFRGAASGTNIKHIGSTRASAMPVRLPSLDEQHRIVEELDSIHSTLETARSEGNALRAVRSSLLTDIFGGA